MQVDHIPSAINHVIMATINGLLWKLNENGIKIYYQLTFLPACFEHAVRKVLNIKAGSITKLMAWAVTLIPPTHPQ